jgi:hypothetical protein
MWRRLAMWHEIHWMRLVVFVCAAGAVLHLLVAAAVFAECWLNPEAQWGPSWRGASGLPYFGPGNFDPFTAAVTGLWPYRITIGGWSNDWVWVHPAAAHAILAFLLVPLAFWALPQTLRRARVHRRHVLRVWLYSLVPLPLVLAVWGGGVWMFTHLFTTLNALVYELTGLAIFDDEPTFYLRCQEYVSEHDGAVLTVLVGVWLWWWWSMAVGRYLRLPRPWAVGAAMVVIAGLAGGLLLMIIPSVGGLWLERVWG